MSILYTLSVIQATLEPKYKDIPVHNSISNLILVIDFSCFELSWC